MSIGEFKWWRVAVVAVIATAGYTVILRGMIEFVHPKLGWVPAVVYSMGGDRLGAWTLQHVYGPVYDYLTGVVWGPLWDNLVIGVLAAVLVENLLVERRGS